MRKKTRHYEVNRVDAFGKEHRIDIVRATSPKKATEKIVNKYDSGFGGHLRTYPVKLTKNKSSSFW